MMASPGALLAPPELGVPAEDVQVASRRTALSCDAATLHRWHVRPGAFERLAPPWQAVRVERRDPAGVADGSRVTLRVGPGGLVRWVAEHRDVRDGAGFVDVQVDGPFGHWQHAHRFETVEAGAVLEDRIHYRLPWPPLGPAVAGRWLAADLDRMLRFRHFRTASDLQRHAAWAARPRLRVAVSGATGFLGAALVGFLETGGHDVACLVRRPGADHPHCSLGPIAVDAPPSGPDPLEGFDAVVHLGGAPIAQRWTTAARARIRDSRVHGTRALAERLAQLERKPRVLVAASAVGVHHGGFLAEVVKQWEAAAEPAQAAGIRTVHARFGVILGAGGGALAKMLPAFQLGLGGPIGSGDQWLSWISRDDAIAAVHHALWEPALQGPVHVTAPTPVAQRDFARTLGRVLGRPAVLPLPAWVVRAVFGAMGDETLLRGERVEPTELSRAGFRFLSGDLETALRAELGRPAAGVGYPRLSHNASPAPEAA